METSRNLKNLPRFRLAVLMVTLALVAGLYFVMRAEQQNTAFIEALKNGDDVAARRLLAGGADANLNMPIVSLQRNMFETLLDNIRGQTHRTHRARSALMQAVSSGKPDLVKDLLAHGADVGYSQDNGNTALLNSAFRKRSDCLEILIAHHADVRSRNRTGQTPLHVAANAGSVACVRALLAHGADINARDGAGNSPLQVAYNGQHLDVVLILLENGANYWEIDRAPTPPLAFAAQMGDIPLLQALWSRYLSLKVRKRTAPLALEMAISYDQVRAVKFFFDSGLTLNDLPLQPVYTSVTSPQPSGRLAVAYSSSGGKAPLLRPPTVTIVRTGRQARPSPLISAARKSDRALFDLLLAHGADVNAPETLSGCTPLIAAAETASTHGGFSYGYGHKLTDREREVEKNQVEMARALLARGANVNARDQSGSSALLHGTGDLEMLRLLIQHGADVHIKDSSGRTPLMQVADAEAARLLIAAGVDINAQNNQGRTALMEAALVNRVDVVKVLLQKGANPNATDLNGNTIVMQLTATAPPRYQAACLSLIRAAGGK